MDRFDDVEAFLAIVERGNLSAAARHLGRSLQAVSRSLATLERSVGVELVRRTTHKAQPTEAGHDFYRRVKPAFLEIVEARIEAGNRSAEPSGLLKVGAPELFGHRYLVPILARFMEMYPRLEIELNLSNRFVDLAEEGLDLAIRIGELPDSDLKARRLGIMRRVVFGAPSYFEKRARPSHPRDLAEHHCVFRNTDRDAGAWQFQEGGKPLTVKVGGRLHLDNAAASHAAIAIGLGIGRVPLWQIQDLVDSGTVEVILEEFEQPAVPVHIVWPAARLPLAKTRLFIDFLAANLHIQRRERDCIVA